MGHKKRPAILAQFFSRNNYSLINLQTSGFRVCIRAYDLLVTLNFCKRYLLIKWPMLAALLIIYWVGL